MKQVRPRQDSVGDDGPDIIVDDDDSNDGCDKSKISIYDASSNGNVKAKFNNNLVRYLQDLEGSKKHSRQNSNKPDSAAHAKSKSQMGHISTESNGELFN